MTTAESTDPKRRKPRQERSQRRVASILGAAGELLEDVGYIALTTNAIAAKARTSIGSLYQFFPNKEAVVAELVKDFREELQSFFNSALSPDLARRSITNFVDVVVDGIEGLRDRMPGFSSVFSFRRHGGTVDDQKIQLEHDIMVPLADLLAKAYPDVSEEQRERCMRVVTETTKVLMSKAATESKETQEWMTEELKQMLGLYLASYFGDGESKAGQ
jgi:AcrR family transcriptional regulator